MIKLKVSGRHHLWPQHDNMTEPVIIWLHSAKIGFMSIFRASLPQIRFCIRHFFCRRKINAEKCFSTSTFYPHTRMHVYRVVGCCNCSSSLHYPWRDDSLKWFQWGYMTGNKICSVTKGILQFSISLPELHFSADCLFLFLRAAVLH